MGINMILLPLIAAVIGWFTNYIAVKMLFHPRVPINVLGIKIQGIFPKRQKKLAEKIGEIVGQELLSLDDIKSKLSDPTNLDAVKVILDQKVDHFLRHRLTEVMPMIAMFASDDLINKIKVVLVKELELVLPEVIDGFVDNLGKSFDIKEVVQHKVENFSFEKLEAILFAIMQKEFRFIELVGAVLGFVIGCIQVVLVYWL